MNLKEKSLRLSKIQNKKVQAGALYYVIFVSFTLSAVVVFFIILRSLKCQAVRTELQYYHRIDDLNSAITLYLSNPSEYQKSKSVLIFPFSDSTRSVLIERTQWGLYDILTAKTIYKDKQLNKTVLAGKDPFKTDSIALYLTENNQSIYASGSTRIIGNVRIPKRGIQRASIEGKPLQTDKLITGISNPSQEHLPRLPANLIKKIKNTQNQDSLFSIGYQINNVNKDILNNSFAEPTIWLTTKKDLIMDGFQSTGNLGVLSINTILVDSTCQLERTILSGSKIAIEDGFKGSVQLIARDSIIIGKNCNLFYPSVICLNNENLNNIYLEIGESSSIEGTIIVYQQYPAAERPNFKIGNGCIITGQIYHGGIIELYGEIHGSLWCEGLYLKSPRAFYYNHLLDNVIDFSLLPKEMIMLDFMNGHADQAIDFIDENI